MEPRSMIPRRKGVDGVIVLGAVYGVWHARGGRSLDFAHVHFMALINSTSRVHGHGAMGTSQQCMNRRLAYDSDERREDFVPFRGLFRSSCGCLADEIRDHG